MTATVESLVITMSADLTRMEKAMAQARSQVNRRLTEIENRFTQMNGRIARSGDQMGEDLRRAIAGLGILAATRDLGGYADAWTNLRNQVRQYADVVGPVDQATARLVDVANAAGVEVSSLGQTFAASARAARTLGASASDVFAFNEAVGKGASIANTGVAAVNGALTQLGQAIGSPKVQLGEFNSVIEGTPRLAQAFADGITQANGSVARLRELIASGEISGGELFAGLLSQLPKLRTEFAQAETTIGRAMATLRNAVMQYVGEADRSLGVSQALVGAINAVAQNLDLLASAAVATAVVFGGKGLMSAYQAVNRQLIEIGKTSADLSDALRQSAVEWRKQVVETSKASAVADALVGANRKIRDTALEAVLASGDLASAYRAEMVAAQEVAKAKVALQQVNLQAAQGTGPQMLRLEAVRLATLRLQEAEANLSALRKTAPAEVRAYWSANEALAKSQLDAANAARAQATAQAQLSTATARAAGAGAAVRGAFSGLAAILSGPVGTIALIAAVTAGLELLSRKAPTAADAIAEVRTKLEAMRAAESEVATATDKLRALNEQVTEAMEAQGDAARATAAADIKALEERIRKNQELADLYREQATAELGRARARDASQSVGEERELRRLALSASVGALSGQQSQAREFYALSATVGAVGGSLDGIAAPTGEQLSQLAAAAVEEARRAVKAGEQISVAQQRLLDLNVAAKARAEEIASLERAVSGKGDSQTGTGIQPLGSSSGDTSRLRLFTTALEDYNATIKEIGASTESASNKSRAAVQALIDFARASKDASMAIEQLPSVSSILLPEDEVIARGELAGLIEAEWEEARRVQRDAMERFHEDLRTFADEGLDANPFGNLDAGVEGLADRMRKAAEDAGWIDTEQMAVFRDRMRGAVKDALRDGIATDDWGTAVRNVFAEAVTAGLDDALNRLGDYLADMFFKKGGGLDSLVSFGASIFNGGGRAAGGPTMMNAMHKVNETGRGEFLFMGNNPGQVLTAGQINGLVAKGGRGGVTINSPFTVMGNVTEDVLPKVEQMLARRDRMLMETLPRAIDARVIESRMRRRY